MKRLLILIVLTLLVLGSLLAYSRTQVGHMTLLAVAEKDGGVLEGSTADLTLTLQPGTGRVFLDTQPASKLDTQMSTRLAKNIACKFVGADCSHYDFFYTITSGSVIIGGPSASSSVALLTAAMLKGIPLRTDIAFTGTISSGNLVGSVAGIQKKIDAAAGAHLQTVLIPAGSRFVPENELTANATDASAATIDLVAYGHTKGVIIIEVSRLDEAFEQFTGKKIATPAVPLEINKQYQKTMQVLGLSLCERSAGLQKNTAKLLIGFNELNQTNLKQIAEAQEIGFNLTLRGQDAYNAGAYYSAASFCFGANVAYKGILYRLQHGTKKELKDLFSKIAADIIKLNAKVNAYPITTITDLQAYMIVKERLIEANDRLVELNKQLPDLSDDDVAGQLGLVVERTYSALAWSAFFNASGRTFEMNNESLRDSCDKKLSETLEFYQYANLLYPNLLAEAKRQMEKATGFQHHGNYALCLFKAAIAKAQINILLSTATLKETELAPFVDNKIAAAEEAVARQQQEDIFPVLGYSYVEYAKSLRDENPVSALLYTEYALELSNLDDYLRPILSSRTLIRTEVVLIFVAGILIGLLCAEVYHQLRTMAHNRKTRKKRT